MRRERVLAGLTGLFLFAAGAAHGQTPAGEDPSREVFETATVKHFTLTTDLLFIGTHGGPGTRNPGRITYEAMNIPELLVLAYGVKSYLISDPAIHQERYVIEATIRKDATKQQVNQMLQNLLAERFKLALHRETEDRPLYEMVVAETGSKLKRFMPTPSAVYTAGFTSDGVRLLRVEPANITPDMDLGSPVEWPGISLTPPDQQGVWRLAGEKRTMSQLADYLSIESGRPVLDKTGLNGKYDLNLEYAIDKDEAEQGRRLGRSVFSLPVLFNAIQDQFGLKLAPKIGPIEMLVIDDIEKMPNQN